MRERIKRPEPQRKQPIRNWSTLFGVPPAGNSGPTSDPVTRGVQMGYQVIEEYMRQGQRVASSFSDPGRAGLPVAPDMANLTERMFQYASDFASVWFEAMGAMGSNGSNGANGTTKGPAAPASAAGTYAPAERAAKPTGDSRPESHASGVRISVESKQPTTVTVDLQPGPADANLSIPPLRAAGSSKAKLAGATIGRAKHGPGIELQVRVPDRHPAGTYSGSIVDLDTNLPRGTLTVRIGR